MRALVCNDVVEGNFLSNMEQEIRPFLLRGFSGYIDLYSLKFYDD